MRLWLAGVAFVVAACGSTPKESFYTLSDGSPPPPAPQAGAPTIHIGTVAVPEEVDRTPMVIRTGPGKVEIDDVNRWVEPLKNAIPRALAGMLMRELGTPNVLAGRGSAGAPPDFRIAIDVQRFESSFTEGATLDAAWTVTPAKGAARTGRTYAREAAPSADHAGIAAAHRRALEKLARDLASAIR